MSSIRAGRHRTPLTQQGSHGTVTAQAEGAEVIEIAFSSAFNHGNDVVGIPEAAPAVLFDGPVLQKRLAAAATGTPELPKRGNGVNAASRADTAVAQENLIAQIRRLGSQLPLMNAVGRAEGKAAARNLERTPSAQPTTVRTAGNRLAIDPAPAHGAHRTHHSFCKWRAPRRLRISRKREASQSPIRRRGA